MRPRHLIVLVAAAGVAGCGGGDASAVLERARARSEAVTAAEWSYGTDTLPGEPGETTPRIVDRCRVTLPADSDDGVPRTVDVACGLLFIALEPAADSAWIQRVMRTLDAEVVDRGTLPSWSTALDEPVSYLLVRVEPGREQRTLQRALASDGVRFVDVREVARRAP